MSLYRISLIVFFVSAGFVFLFDLGPLPEVVAGTSAWVCVFLLVIRSKR